MHNLNYAANILFAEVGRILMKNNNAKEKDNDIDRSLLLLLLDSNRTQAVNTLIRENANTINTTNAKDNEKSQKVNWWIRFTWN